MSLKKYLVTNQIDCMKLTLKKRSLISARAWTDPKFSVRDNLYWFRSESNNNITIFAKIFENKFSPVSNDQTADRNASVEQDWSFFNNQIIWAIFRIIPWDQVILRICESMKKKINKKNLLNFILWKLL